MTRRRRAMARTGAACVRAALLAALAQACAGGERKGEAWGSPAAFSTVGQWLGAGPALAGGMAFVGTGDGRLAAIDAATGRPAWSVRLAGGYVRARPFADAANELVYAATSGGWLYKLTAKGGLVGSCRAAAPVEWMAGDPDAGRGTSLFAVAGGGRVAGMSDRSIPDEGRRRDGGDAGEAKKKEPSCTPLWTAQLGGKLAGEPAARGGALYATTFDGRFLAYDLKSGRSLVSLPRTVVAEALLAQETAKGPGGTETTAWRLSVAVAANVETGAARDVVGRLLLDGVPYTPPAKGKEGAAAPSCLSSFSVPPEGHREDVLLEGAPGAVAQCRYELYEDKGGTPGALVDTLPCTITTALRSAP